MRLNAEQRQQRPTVVFDRPVAAAAERTVQCVPSAGLLSRTVRSNCATLSSSWVLGRPGRASP
jgi:hypothetical protein